ncbi:hypothetical protein ACJMK2_037963 [Sinanodonta woodiana]|uniref:Uncharacterized protein n=1 Tax=Sinanodonta woodiana TaxID=1069815 RepID=A0ABD3WMH7_SINWO
MTDDSLNNMLNILPIAENTRLTADEAMNTDIIDSVNDSDIPIDNSSVNVTDKILPWGTPISCWCISERVEPTRTLNSLSERKLEIKEGRRPLRPRSPFLNQRRLLLKVRS